MYVRAENLKILYQKLVDSVYECTAGPQVAIGNFHLNWLENAAYSPTC